MDKTVRKALKFANFKHQGQFDKAGVEYILHPIEVAMSEYLTNDTQRAMALLHDTLEDTETTYQELLDEFGVEIAEGVYILSHRDGETYQEYIHRIKSSCNSNVIRVKIADLDHNSDLSRIKNVTEKDIKRKEKYEKAKFDLCAYLGVLDL